MTKAEEEVKKLQTKIKEDALKIKHLENITNEYADLTFEKNTEIQQLRGVIKALKEKNIENQVNL